MREEEKNLSKNSWKRVFRKKWFFPSVYLIAAALLLTAVVWYQNSQNEDEAKQNETTDSLLDSMYDEEAAPVMDQQENIHMPVAGDEATIVTKFYDFEASAEEQEQALVLYNNRYYQSKGVDIARQDGEEFDVTASLSGTVTEVLEDSLLGQVVEVTHQDGVTTKYMSLSKVAVEVGAQIKQDDVIGTAGRNLFGQANGVHVHFELRKDDQPVDPETFFNQPFDALRDTDQSKEEGDKREEGEEPKEEAPTSEQPAEGEEGNESEEPTSDDAEEGTDKEQTDENETPDGSESTEDTESSISMANA
ncbi:stage II sporulation protein [Pontibacillus halophilus JSM 076056 = DSM 19796]|uniref:Stage II sporulation protein n=1 Tax=Pontibacillus halophilus JSM 076056 = DSM 19796 TaxID=1385510 RepID=A0A0A5GPI8_9BACI|nr:M23 family metallopeptidase [Pontibacillus halophilus]KGX93899.1 stage II sporulation protein [Pontibacillus halophilus JSM 076056 = DSM 19796]